MTNADYVAIAVSPALVMALVGSLVFFLIEVLYVGDYTVRLNYVFALFVFATVLIARIAIEMGSERAAMFSLPLGLLMFLALGRFVEHAGAFGWLINIGLLTGVWWSSHKLTWDCTVIDDNQDSSGEGLLGRVGLDPLEGPESGSKAAKSIQPSGPSATGNELFNDPADGESPQPNLWKRLVSANTGPHTPGLWVLYFSLAALPLFGIGQHWIPVRDVGRRRYAFGLLAVYVAAGLSLLVTTSFLGLRRYLRQRNVEMPAPMAATWLTLGGMLILLVMFVAALLPRPAAEYAVAQPPWRVGSPGDNSANRLSAGNEGTVDPDADQRVTSDNQADAPHTGDATAEATSEQSTAGDQAGEGEPKGEGQSDSPSGESNISEPSSNAPSPNDTSPRDEGDRPVDENAEHGEASQSEDQHERESSYDKTEERGPSERSPPGDSQSTEEAQTASKASPPQSPLPDVSAMMATLTSSIGALVKLVCYALLTLAVCYFAWRNWPAIVRAFFEIVQMIRDLVASLFGSAPKATEAVGAGQTATSPAPRRTFADFTDPFVSGRDKKASPVELVRYTFEAFEAWSGDRGRVRTPDQTPQEFLRVAAPPQSPLHEEARRMVRLYSEAAYASANVSRETAATLRQLWHLMQSVR